MKAVSSAGLVLTSLLTGCSLITELPGTSYAGPLLALTVEETEIRDRVWQHVQTLAGQIGARNFWHEQALEAAANYIEQTLRELGYQVSTQEVPTVWFFEEKIMRNLEAELVGAFLPEEIILVGAHYDTRDDSPGADDNSTGVAALLEIARLLRHRELARTIRLVAFTNEELPFSRTDAMGSLVYARRSAKREENIIGMISIETIGYYSDSQGSQRYPFPLDRFYPGTGNFIGFVGNLASLDLVSFSIASFREHTRFPSEGIAGDGLFDLGRSDHWSFWQMDYPAIMVTDSALYRYDHYHSLSDTPDKIDYDRTAQVVAGLARVVADLAEETE